MPNEEENPQDGGIEEAGNNPQEGERRNNNTEIYMGGRWHPLSKGKDKKITTEKIGESIEGTINFGRTSLSVTVTPIKMTKANKLAYAVKVSSGQHIYGGANLITRVKLPKKEEGA
jgi:hypothetical protein